MPDRLPRTAEVLIVGGGIHGVSLAYHLGERGCRDVVVLEKDRLGSGSTGAAAGGVRHQFSTEINVKLSIESIRALRAMAQATDNRIGLRPNGYLILATRPQDLEGFRRTVSMQRRLGVDVSLLKVDEVQALAPFVNVEDVLGATFCPDDGWVDPYSVLQVYARRARERGARFFEGTEVVGIRVQGGRVRGVRTPRGDVEAPLVVDAAGPWLARVAQMAHLELPVRPYRRQSFVSEPLPALPWEAPFIVDFATGFYFHKEDGGGVLFGMGDPEEPPSFNTTVDWAFLERVTRQALHRAPFLAEARVIRGWAGLYAVTPDHNPIIGPTPLEGFYVVGGFSGHGFMHAPAVGRALAERLTEGRYLDLDLSPLSYRRFETETEPLPEKNVI